MGDSYQYLSDFPLLYPFHSLQGTRILEASTEQELLNFLHKNRINVILVNEKMLKISPNWKFIIHSDEFVGKYGSLIYSGEGIKVYCMEAPTYKDASQPNTAKPSCLK